MPAKPIVQLTKAGLYCSAGQFYIDPQLPVERAVITHAHSDHARRGHGVYYCASTGLSILQHRLGAQWKYRPVAYGEPFKLGSASVSLHPAGHILGSAQVRIEVDGEIWVVSGDYKRDSDPTCEAFEVVPCHTFITEATFGLPIYQWQSGAETASEIYDWWQQCRQKDRTAVLFCYALGKAQRVLSELRAYTDEPVYLHGSVDELTRVYRDAGINMVPTLPIEESKRGNTLAGELIIAPPATYRSTWMKHFGTAETGFASGWMRVRGGRRHRGYDRGFVLSDHADWSQLIQTIQETGAEKILVTHGKSDVLVRYLQELGYMA
jgi:putative mRNA 3-end processing factor